MTILLAKWKRNGTARKLAVGVFFKPVTDRTTWFIREKNIPAYLFHDYDVKDTQIISIELFHADIDNTYIHQVETEHII